MFTKIKLHGAFTLTLEKADGTVEVTHKDNLVVNSGYQLIAEAVFNSAGRPAIAEYIAIGTGATAALASDLLLGSEVTDYSTPNVRPAGVYSFDGPSKAVTLTHTFGPGDGTGALTEAGVFNASSRNGGTMLDRVVFPTVTKQAEDTLTVTFTFTLS